jgi:hypothetical protein
MSFINDNKLIIDAMKVADAKDKGVMKSDWPKSET